MCVYNLEMNRWSAKGGEAEMPIDLDCLPDTARDSPRRVFPVVDDHYGHVDSIDTPSRGWQRPDLVARLDRLDMLCVPREDK
jgi:hypothetical protein